MTAEIALPTLDGRIEAYRPVAAPLDDAAGPPPRSRVVLASVHVVADPMADNTPDAPAVLDWEATLSFRRHIWRHGLAVAEAMDTAQRGMGLDWATTRQLIRRSAAESRSCGGRIAAGVGTDQLGPGRHPLDAVVSAYEEQLAVVTDSGAQPVLMASRQLCASAASPDDYAKVYGRLLQQSPEPVILHWLGQMFDPALAGYWGAESVERAADVVLSIIGDHRDRVDGIKLSLLDADLEIDLRRRLPPGVRLYTGDDFHYPELIRGDGTRHSDALLGIFAAIAPAAALALRALDAGDLDAYDRVLAPTVPLARHIFGAPTSRYKTGIAFLAWLAGQQPGFTMVGGLQSGRSLPHLAETFRLADTAGLLPDPELAVDRMRRLLAVAGVEACASGSA